jgi:hypothetical protein
VVFSSFHLLAVHEPAEEAANQPASLLCTSHFYETISDARIGGGGNCTRVPNSASRFEISYLRRAWMPVVARCLHRCGPRGSCRELAPLDRSGHGRHHGVAAIGLSLGSWIEGTRNPTPPAETDVKDDLNISCTSKHSEISFRFTSRQEGALRAFCGRHPGPVLSAILFSSVVR